MGAWPTGRVASVALSAWGWAERGGGGVGGVCWVRLAWRLGGGELLGRFSRGVPLSCWWPRAFRVALRWPLHSWLVRA
uniref:Putative secreted protein n=1 Tax=Ixodes ricinus TaxID=34613 RepID=A0A6B0U5E2_IXORI